MGIDWTKRIRGTLSGKRFDYIENTSHKECLQFGEMKALFIQRRRADKPLDTSSP